MGHASLLRYPQRLEDVQSRPVSSCRPRATTISCLFCRLSLFSTFTALQVCLAMFVDNLQPDWLRGMTDDRKQNLRSGLKKSAQVNDLLPLPHLNAL